MKLILIKPGCLPGCPVAGNPVPDLILNHQHAQFLELLSQFADVKTNQAVLGVYIGLVVEDLVGTFDIDFQHRCQVFRVRFAHFQQTRVKVFQDGQVFRNGLLQIFLIDQLNTAVKHRLFFRFETAFATCCQLDEGEDEIHLERDRILFLAVVQVEVQRIDVLIGIDRDAHHLTFQRTHQRGVFAFRVGNDDLILCHQKSVGDLPFGCKGLA